jgi:CheY-like chemotaxis protein
MATVLVVDDESQIRELLVRWISADGYVVRAVGTSQAALDDMQITPADIVLCDVQMPGENGLWLTGQLRSRFPETAIVLATSDRGVSSQVSLQLGVVEYLPPFTRDQVLAAEIADGMCRRRRTRAHAGIVSLPKVGGVSAIDRVRRDDVTRTVRM